jgi:hypothetical protein
MPIIGCDPWRTQFFDHVPCPPDVVIPLKDFDAWRLFPAHRWVYDKMAVALTQGLDAAPHGVPPPSFPVFSKPIINLRSMGSGSRVIETEDDYRSTLTAGHIWCTLLTGEHVSTDAAVLDGHPVWWRHATGAPAPGGTFDYWHIHAEPNPAVEAWCGDWIRKNLAGYTGMINLETIGARIIECHLRFADQWPDLYGAGWVEAFVAFYAHKRWTYPDTNRVDGYSVVLFGPHGPRYRHPPATLVEEVSAIDGVSSVQISFHQDRDPATHSMPPGGFRLATINATSLAAGQRARSALADVLLTL